MKNRKIKLMFGHKYVKNFRISKRKMALIHIYSVDSSNNFSIPVWVLCTVIILKIKISKNVTFFVLKLFFIGDWRRVHAPTPGPTQCTGPHRRHWEQVQNQRQQYQVKHVLGYNNITTSETVLQNIKSSLETTYRNIISNMDTVLWGTANTVYSTVI